MPSVVVTGARQTGKSTLCRGLFPEQRRCYSLDELDVIEAAVGARMQPVSERSVLHCMPRCVETNLTRIQAVKYDQHQRGGECDADAKRIQRAPRVRNINILE